MARFLPLVFLHFTVVCPLTAAPQITTENWNAGIRDFAEIERWDIVDFPESKEEFAKLMQALKSMKGIRELSLYVNERTEEWFAEMASLPIQSLHLTFSSDQKVKGFDAWRKSKTLQRITLDYSSPEQCEQIYSLTQLKHLKFVHPNTEINLKGIEQLKELESLTIIAKLSVSDWEIFSELKSLKSLDLIVTHDSTLLGLKAEHCNVLKKLKQLRSLKVAVMTNAGGAHDHVVVHPCAVDDIVSEVICSLPQLEELSLTCAILDQSSLKKLAKAPRLETLRFPSTELDLESMKILQEFPKLRCLDLSQRLTKGTGELLAKIPLLRQFQLTNAATSEGEIVILLNSGKLEALELTGCELTEKLFEGLKKNIPLRALSLKGCQTNFTSLKPLASAFPELEFLDLWDCQVSDSKEFRSLRCLRISDFDPDTIIDDLQSLKKLDALNLYRFSYDAGAYIALDSFALDQLQKSRKWRYLSTKPSRNVPLEDSCGRSLWFLYSHD